MGEIVARIRYKDVERIIEEYKLGIEGRDIPRWSEEKRREMEEEYSRIADDIARVRRTAIECAEEHKRPRADRAKYVAISLKAWSLSKQEVTDEEYVKELEALAVKLGVTMEYVAKVLECIRSKGVGVRGVRTWRRR